MSPKKYIALGQFDRNIPFHFIGAIVFWVVLIKAGRPLAEANTAVMAYAISFELGQSLLDRAFAGLAVIAATALSAVWLELGSLTVLAGIGFYELGRLDTWQRKKTKAGYIKVRAPQPVEIYDIVAAAVPCAICSLFLTFYGA